MPKPTKPPMVMIEWEDSAQAVPQWQWLAGVEAPPILTCLSVGFLIRDTAKEKALAISVASADGGDPEQVSGVISIPTRCVKRIEQVTSSSRRPYDRGAAS